MCLGLCFQAKPACFGGQAELRLREGAPGGHSPALGLSERIPGDGISGWEVASPGALPQTLSLSILPGCQSEGNLYLRHFISFPIPLWTEEGGSRFSLNFSPLHSFTYVFLFHSTDIFKHVYLLKLPWTRGKCESSHPILPGLTRIPKHPCSLCMCCICVCMHICASMYVSVCLGDAEGASEYCSMFRPYAEEDPQPPCWSRR